MQTAWCSFNFFSIKKMKKIYVLAAAAIMAASSATSVMAQLPLQFGLRAGLNLNKVVSKSDNKTETTDNKVGFNVGATVASYFVGDMLGLQSGLGLATRGGKTEASEEGSTYSSSMSIYELQLPVFVAFQYAFNDDFKVKANVGPTFNIGLSGKTKWESKSTYNGQTESRSGEGDMYKKPDGADKAPYKRFEVGLGFGGGVEFKKIYLGIGYDLGLSSIVNDDDYTMTGRSFMINVGYTF
jgi:hypothetical protein